ncbi:dehydrogenase/reductase SDR family member 9-like [Oppia nitens]|uniref:dehydrogenase/reductase SDR family member 9-like n=1 Tax=Oppia nitens TaxID=1686743 RepID=UPI0023DCC564|nr:dehydrogenase/reductase SDR family member 9-like [Oppia nitens]
MLSNKKSLLNCFVVQYVLTFVILLLLVCLSCCLNEIVTTLGSIVLLTIISWFVTKQIRKSLNNEFVTSYKRAVLITGCDSGFGNALAQTLNEHGFRVYATVLDTDSDGAKKLVTSARFDGMTTVLRMDVTNDEEVNAVYEQITKELQQNGEQLWAVVNNAGIITWGPLDWGTVDKYKRIFEVNTFGTVRVTRTFLPLIRQSKGRIVNLVSMNGRLTFNNETIYSMSKYAAISFSDALRRETRKWGVKVSTIEPMAYRTPLSSNEYFTHELDKQWTESTQQVRQLYGKQYYENLRHRDESTSTLSVGNNIYEVIDKLVDAVRSTEPLVRYVSVPGTPFDKFLTFLIQLMPTELYDYYIELKNSRKSIIKPAALQTNTD